MFRARSLVRKRQLQMELLENRLVPSSTPVWSSYAHDPQHTDISTVASQALETIRWSTPVDLAPNYVNGGELLIHYGSPLVTVNNTVLVPVKTTSAGGYRIEAHNGATGQLMWEVSTDYQTPDSNWTPSFAPVLTPQGRLYFPGIGGTIYYIDNPDSSTTPVVGHLAFYGLNLYNTDTATFNTNVKISTPITSDSAGNIYFGFVAAAATSANLKSGLARISAGGAGSWAAASTMATDSNIASVAYNCAPALSHDEQIVYVGVNSSSFGSGYLLAVDSSTLAPVAKVLLKDPLSGNNSEIPNISTASPVVGPDGDVYYGVIENPFPENNDRGWLLHFSGDLKQTKTPGAFGWDDTPSIVPASMVPSYHGSSSYLLMAKYNNYAGIGTGDGLNKVAILDSNDQTQTDPITGVTVMNPVLSILGPTQEQGGQGVREWCINAAAVDPATGSVLVNSEDGTLYRWVLATNSFTQHVQLAPPTGEAYTPTVIGGDGTVYAINNATLWAVGQIPTLSVADIQVNQSTSASVNAVFTITLAHAGSQQVTVNYATADGSALAGQDYVATSGTLTFAPGQTTQTVSVSVPPATAYAPTLTFMLDLSGATNANIQDASAVASILNPITPPSISIGDASGVDGQEGTTAFKFHVTLSSPSSQSITVDFATANGTASAPADYASAQGVVTFSPGQTSQDVVVNVVANPQSHPVKTFAVNLANPTNATLQDSQATGTILNDQGALSVSDVSGTVSATSPTNYAFIVSLTDPVTLPVTVFIASADGTALAGVDYQQLASTQLTFDPGQTSIPVTVVVNRNSNPGPTLDFTVNLSNPTNAIISDGSGDGKITNQNSVSIIAFSSDTFSASETDRGVAIIIVRSGDLTKSVSVNFAAGGGNSSSPTEYQPVTQTVTFQPGDTVKNVIVPFIDDHQLELPEHVELKLSNPSAGSQLGSLASATLTIRDRDGTASERYVFNLYESLFQRAADQGGLAYWSGILNRGIPRAQVVSGLIGSSEYQSIEVNNFYQAYLKRNANASELSAGVAVLAAGSPMGLPAAEDHVRATILESDEYFQTRGGSDNASFLNALYQDLLGRNVDSVGAMVFGNALAGGASRTQIALAILLSKETDQFQVKAYYNRFLQRPGDTGGVNYFAGLLQQGYRETLVVTAMAASDEFFILSQ
jgi:cytochrome c oxidase assembly protein Cox11